MYNYYKLEEVEEVYPEELTDFLITRRNYLDMDKKFKGEGLIPKTNYYRNKRVLITGISGFAGSHLAEKLLDLGASVYGIVRRHAVPLYENIKHLKDEITLFEGDITSQNRMKEIVCDINPNSVFHLAAESFVPTSFREPSRVAYNNIIGTINVYEAVKDLGVYVPISVACSSEEYGLVNQIDVPITEEQEFKPRSIYGITKISTEHIANVYRGAYGMSSYITRAFNHEGPRRGLQFVTSVIHRQIAECIKGLRNNIVIGNPNAIRDFTHVKDTIGAYLLLQEKGLANEPYNICSGYGVTIGDYARIAMDMFGFDVDILIDKKRMRPSDVPILIGSNDKIFRDYGWKPKYSIIDIIDDGVKYFLDHEEYLEVERH